MNLLQQTEQAYYDCVHYGGESWEEVAEKRQLKWRWSGRPFSSNSPILAEALQLIGLYNNFDPEVVISVLQQFPITVVLARENSVCLYIYGIGTEKGELLAALGTDEDCMPDEADVEPDGSLRLWWD